jgi:hypothetical protein
VSSQYGREKGGGGRAQEAAVVHKQRAPHLALPAGRNLQHLTTVKRHVWRAGARSDARSRPSASRRSQVGGAGAGWRSRRLDTA